jgi:hypothetical protein
LRIFAAVLADGKTAPNPGPVRTRSIGWAKAVSHIRYVATEAGPIHSRADRIGKNATG